MHSASVRCANRTTSLQLSNEMPLFSNPHCARRDRAEFAPLKIFSRTKCKIFGISARHAHQQMRAFDQRALCKPSDVTGSGSRVGSPSDFESTRIRRRDHAYFAPKFHDRKATFPEFWRAARTKNACIRPACVAQTQRHRCNWSPSRHCVQSQKSVRPSSRSRRCRGKFA